MQDKAHDLLLLLTHLTLLENKQRIKELFIASLNSIFEPLIFQYQSVLPENTSYYLPIETNRNLFGYIVLLSGNHLDAEKHGEYLHLSVQMLGLILERTEKREILEEKSSTLEDEVRLQSVEIKVREQRIRLYEKQFRQLLENISLFSVILSEKGNILFANDFFCRSTGWNQEELKGTQFVDKFIVEEERNFAWDIIRNIIEDPDSKESRQLKLLTRDGEKRIILWSFVQNTSLKNNKISIAIIGQDITVYEKSASALRESENRFRILYNSVPAGVYVQDKEYNFVSVNEHACKIFGLSYDEFTDVTDGKHWVVLDENGKEFKHKMRPSSKAVEVGEATYGAIVGAYKTKRSSLRWLLLNAVPVHAEDGETVEEVIVSFQDITEFKEIQDTLKERSLALEKRVREIDCLYQLNKKLRTDTKNLYEVLRNIILTLPDAWQYPDRTCVKLSLFGQEFITPNYKECYWKQTSDIWIDDDYYGMIEVGYIENESYSSEMPFIEEERILLDTIAITISEYIESRIANKKLEQSEKNYRVLVETLPDAVLRISLDGIILYSNKVAADILGFTEEDDLTGSDFFEFLANPDSINVIKKIEIIYKKEYSRNVEFLLKRTDGEIIPVELNASLRHDSEGVPVEFVIIIRDISERLKSEAELKESRERLSLAMDATSDALWDWNFEEKLMFFSPRFYTMLAYEPEEFDASIVNWAKIIHPEDRRHVFNKLKRYLNSELPAFGYEYRIRNGNGRWRWVLTRGKIVDFDEDGKPQRLIGTNQDISHRKEIEQELIAAREEALKSDKLKSEFLAQMSHEIRTPINTLLSASGLIEDMVGELMGDDADTLFKGMRKAGQRIIRTIDLILNMSEVQTGTYKMIQKKLNLVDDIIENIYIEFRQYAKEKNLAFKLNFSEAAESASVAGDEYTINQIFANLIDNAIKYTHAGSINISVDVIEEEHIIEVLIADTGIGISEQYMQNLFDAFSQEERGYTRKYEGSGLGLALVKKYCDMNNAEITVESTKNEGTRFRVKFNII